MGIPAVKNGVLITMNRPLSPPVMRALDGVSPGPQFTATLIPIATELSTIGGLPYTVASPLTDLTVKTRIQGQRILLVGAIITASDGYVGTVAPPNGAGAAVNVL